MGDLHHSGFVFDKHQLEFEKVDSEMTKRNIMKIIQAESREIIISQKRRSPNNKCRTLTGRQFMFHVLLFFNIIKIQVHTMNLRDLPAVELAKTISRCSIGPGKKITGHWE